MLYENLNAIIGGALIGAAAGLLFLVNGRIAGISGITKQALADVIAWKPSQSLWRWAFLLGLPLGAALVHFGFGVPVPEYHRDGALLAIIAGLLVGTGVSIGSGCTSGHGICGLSRLSKRSLVATLCFMSSAFVTVFIARHIF